MSHVYVLKDNVIQWTEQPFSIIIIGCSGKMMQYIYIYVETTVLSEMFIDNDQEVPKALLITRNNSLDNIDKMKRSDQTIKYNIILTRLWC